MLTHARFAKLSRLASAVSVLLLFSSAWAESLTIEAHLEQEKARVAQAFVVRYETSWTGAADAFAIAPGEVEAVPWAEARLVSVTTETREGAFFVTQKVEYVPSETGEFEIPAFSVAYFDPATVQPDASDEEDPDITVSSERQVMRAGAFMVTVRPALSLYIGSGLIAALCLFLGGTAWLVYARNRNSLAYAGGRVAAAVPQTVQAAVHLARQHQLDGKFYEFYKELARASTLLAPSVAARKLREKLEREAQNVGYRAERPSDDEMDGALRDLETAMRSEVAEAE